MKLYFAVVVCVLFWPLSAWASSEDLYDQGNSVGSSGWDLYGDFDDSEAETVEDRLTREREEEKKQEARQRRRRRASDFFSQGVDIYDKSLSRTFNEEKELKGEE